MLYRGDIYNLYLLFQPCRVNYFISTHLEETHVYK